MLREKSPERPVKTCTTIYMYHYVLRVRLQKHSSYTYFSIVTWFQLAMEGILLWHNVYFGIAHITSLPVNGKNILPVILLFHNNTFCHFPIRKFHKKLGQQAWLVAAITVTEFLIVVKYDPNTIMLPIPFFIMQCWFLGILLIFTWTLWRFFIR